MSEELADLIHLPNPKTVPWSDLTPQVQDILRQQFTNEMRDNFKMIENEVLQYFIEHEVADQWKEFHEDWFQREMQSVDTECAWDDWLTDKGISG